jgi:Transposase DDE domain
MRRQAAKKITGRTRHLLIDPHSLVLNIVVRRATVQDRIGAKLVLGALGAAFARLQRLWADRDMQERWGNGVVSN